MKRHFMTLMIMALAVTLVFGNAPAFASDDGFGAASIQEGLETDESFELSEMLTYALEDEYHARAEYDLIIENFDVERPFTNIMGAEERHIEWLLPLFESYDVEIPQDISSDYVVLPETLTETFSVGVDAEILNIDMYEAFLKQELPDDVRLIFERLKRASENHLKAFERNLSTSGTSQGGTFGKNRGDRWGNK